MSVAIMDQDICQLETNVAVGVFTSIANLVDMVKKRQWIKAQRLTKLWQFYPQQQVNNYIRYHFYILVGRLYLF